MANNYNIITIIITIKCTTSSYRAIGRPTRDEKTEIKKNNETTARRPQIRLKPPRTA